MLEVKNLVKTYRPKGGVEVKALDDVSVTFPETGMVFLLGKSGSGKSTLLNVCGGLDTPDSGEIVIFGRSSKTFSDGDFDSYRNTFVGFIFQEYNILNEFTVEENLALALELQGKNKNAQKVEELLELVDLKGFEKRKPNTLSGGQKQRIAIARALIKEPKIIMADEPTGALDSATGKQVLDTLKKLSKTRLVIIVSHDVEFAEIYGDRIIELKDGKIISDVTKEKVAAQSSGENISVIAGDTLSLKSGSGATEADLKKIEQFIRSSGGNVIISNGSQSIAAFRQANRIDESGSSERFKRTEEDDIPARTYGKDDCKLVRSRLPILKAARIGVSSLKVKPFRLFLTILLSFAAFLLFGVFTSMMMYNSTDVLIRGYTDSNYDGVMLTKKYYTTERYYDSDGTLLSEYESENDTLFTPEELKDYSARYNGAAGLFTFGSRYDGIDPVNVQLVEQLPQTMTERTTQLNYFGCVDSENVTFVAGTYPANSDEVAISEYYVEVLKYCSLKGVQVSGGYPDYTAESFTIKYAQDAVGKQLYFEVSGRNGSYPLILTISGVFGTGEMPEEFSGWNSAEEVNAWREEDIREFSDYVGQSLLTTGLVTQNMYSDFVEKTGWTSQYESVDYEKYFKGGDGLGYQSSYSEYYVYSYSVYDSSSPDMQPVSWFGEPRQTLAEDEMIISSDDVEQLIYNFYYGSQDPSSYDEQWKESYGQLYTQKYQQAEALRLEYEELANQAYSDGDIELGEEYQRYSYYYSDLASVYQIASEYALDGYNQAQSFLQQMEGGSIVPPQGADDPTAALQGIMSDFVKMFFADTVYTFTMDRDNIVYTFRIVGVYDCRPLQDQGYNTGVYVAKSVYDAVRKHYGTSERGTNYVAPEDAVYSAIYLSYDGTRAAIADVAGMINIVAADDSFVSMSSPLYDSVMSIDMMVSQMSAIFLYVGIGLAVFAALLLFNFISVSISSKTHEIGVLRAVGARGWDVFKIFLVEAVVIAAICLVLAIVCSIVGVHYLNIAITEGMGINFTLFSFNILSVLMMLGVAAVVAFLGTFLPVFRISRKKPVESMRTL